MFRVRKSYTFFLAEVKLRFIIGIVLMSFPLLQSCYPRLALVTEEHDMVFSSRRVKWTKTYFHAVESSQGGFHPFVNLTQIIMKETKPNAEPTYQVFDILTLEKNQFHVDDKVYLIVDKLPMLVNVKRNEHENIRSISENTETCDSTDRQIVTGYTDIQHKVSRINYDLTPELVEKIKNAEKIFFRYYSGPTMITVTPSEADLKSLKEVLNSD